MSDERKPILELRELSVTRGGVVELDKLSCKLDRGETLIVLGDDRSGKDALLRLLGGFAERTDAIGGTIKLGAGEEQAASRKMRSPIRIVYLPGTERPPLNPHASMASQLARVVARRHEAPRESGREELRLALERLPGTPPFDALDRKPGVSSAVVLTWGLLAAALAQSPDLLIADHAFAGLTPAENKAVVAALQAEQKRIGFALLYAARGLQTAAHIRGRVIVLRHGRVIEEGDYDKLAGGQSHAYTRTLFKALAKPGDALPARTMRGEPLLQVHGLDFRPPGDKGPKPRDGLTFELRRGAALALIGEEGSGRRTLMRALLGLEPFTSGRVVLDQVDMSILSAAMTARLRRRIAFITGQDDALDPRMSLWDTVDEPLRAHLGLSRDMVAGHRDTALKRVGLASYDGATVVATLSRFDKRRLQVARAIVSAPFLAVIDEPLRGLDAFAQSIMKELLDDLRKQEGPAFLIVTADVGVAQALAEDAMFFKDGKVVERGALREILKNPRDEETRHLIEAALGEILL